MRAYSIDLRERVVAAAEGAMAHAEIAATFQVSEPTIRRWLRRKRLRGSLTPDVSPGRPAAITAAQRADLKAQLDAHPDAIVVWHADQWNQCHGTDLSRSTMSRAIRQMGWTRKKRP